MEKLVEFPLPYPNVFPGTCPTWHNHGVRTLLQGQSLWRNLGLSALRSDVGS